MGRVKKIVSTVLLGAMMFSLVGCDSIFKRTEESKGKTVLAKVDGEKITLDDIQDELDKSVASYVAYYGEDFTKNEEYAEQYSQLKTNVLNNVIAEKVLMAKKDKLKVKYTDEEIEKDVQEKVDYYKDYYGEEYESFLKENDFTEKTFKEYWKKDSILQRIADKMVEDVEVTDEEVKKYYDENVDSFTVSEAGANVTHLLFRATEKDGEEAINKAKTDCEAARKLILEGKTFKDIEDSYNDTDYCKTENLGFQPFENNQSLVSEFVAGYVNLPENQLSELVKTSYGWHLILNTKIYKASDVQPFEIVKDSVTNTVLSSKKSEEYNKKLEKYEKELDVVRYEKRLKDI